jgi:HAD superfamily hydrolase (TIGR01484 family)
LRYFALACDYDGTLAQDGHVDDKTVDALEQVAASGRRLILVTGRELDDLLEVLTRPALFEWIVAENGALLYNPATREEQRLADPIDDGFASELRQRGVDPVRQGRVIVATWEPHETTVLETIRDLGLELQVVFNKGAVMVLPAGINKATGLQAALERMQLSPHNVAGIGDAENDHAFLTVCEFSAAVANALPLVKERADYVTRKDHGAGVREVANALVGDDLRGLCRSIDRHLIAIGRTADGEEVTLQPAGSSVLIAGTSGSGKSTLAKVLLERLADREYQFCIIDPEGDYEGFEEGAVLGTEKRAPTVDEVMRLLEHPGQNVVVNMLGVAMDDRPSFFASLTTALTEMRARTGRPHWVFVDEAHHLMPVGWEPAAVALPQELYGMLLITVHSDLVSPDAIALIDAIAAVGEKPAETLRAFANVKGRKPPSLFRGPLQPGEAVMWTLPERKVRRFKVAETRLQHLRHRRKYAEGDLGDRSFFFTGPRARLNLRAQNLFLFLQLAQGLDDATWKYHLDRGDYTSWFAEGVKNAELAADADAVRKARLGQGESRDRIREAIEKHYTLPAPGKAAIEMPPRKPRHPGSTRPILSE